jgi:hypothetical protein
VDWLNEGVLYLELSIKEGGLHNIIQV